MTRNKFLQLKPFDRVTLDSGSHHCVGTDDGWINVLGRQCLRVYFDDRASSDSIFPDSAMVDKLELAADQTPGPYDDLLRKSK